MRMPRSTVRAEIALPQRRFSPTTQPRLACFHRILQGPGFWYDMIPSSWIQLLLRHTRPMRSRGGPVFICVAWLESNHRLFNPIVSAYASSGWLEARLGGYRCVSEGVSTQSSGCNAIRCLKVCPDGVRKACVGNAGALSMARRTGRRVRPWRESTCRSSKARIYSLVLFSSAFTSSTLIGTFRSSHFSFSCAA
jgi:hypothetical protein